MNYLLLLKLRDVTNLIISSILYYINNYESIREIEIKFGYLYEEFSDMYKKQVIFLKLHMK